MAAIPDANVTVFNDDDTPAGATVCKFYLWFNPTAGGESGFWELRDSTGAIVEQGEYAVTGTEGDREPNTGFFELPDGAYTLLWDDEPVDLSRKELPIVVDCDAATSAPTGTPEVTPTFQQSVGAETDTPGTDTPGTDTPSQDVGGDTDAPPSLPDTTSLETARPDPGSSWWFVVMLAALLGVLVVLTPRRAENR